MATVPLIVDVLFWVFAGLAMLFGLGVVMVRDIFVAAISLLMALLSLAALFIILSAEFIGAVQILVNVGAVAILLIVTIMVVRDVVGDADARQRAVSVSGFMVSLLVLAVIGVTAYGTDWVLRLGGTLADRANADEVFSSGGVPGGDVVALGQLLLREFLLPLQIAGLIIAATVMSAVTLMRGALSDEPLEEGEGG